MEPQGKLEVAREAGFAGDHSELARGRIQIRIAEIRVVDEIVCFSPKLKTGPLVDWEFFQQTDVPILKAGLVNRIANAALQVEGAVGRLARVRREVTR